MVPSYAQPREIPMQYALVFAVIATLALAFQIGHFFEHFAQFVIWLLGDLSAICGRDTPWVSGWAVPMIDAIGAFVAPAAPQARKTMLGLEVLHLIGNSIFLVGIAASYILTRHKLVWWAFVIEGLHLCEHILLTGSVFAFGKPMGVSTLFGQALSVLPSKEWAVGYRVSWHFVMNLFPMPLVMAGLMESWEKRARRA
jgi:hypothetical protein